VSNGRRYHVIAELGDGHVWADYRDPIAPHIRAVNAAAKPEDAPHSLRRVKAWRDSHREQIERCSARQCDHYV